MLLSRSLLDIFNCISVPSAEWHGGVDLTFSGAILTALGTEAARAASAVFKLPHKNKSVWTREH